MRRKITLGGSLIAAAIAVAGCEWQSVGIDHAINPYASDELTAPEAKPTIDETVGTRYEDDRNVIEFVGVFQVDGEKVTAWDTSGKLDSQLAGQVNNFLNKKEQPGKPVDYGPKNIRGFFQIHKEQKPRMFVFRTVDKNPEALSGGRVHFASMGGVAPKPPEITVSLSESQQIKPKAKTNLLAFGVLASPQDKDGNAYLGKLEVVKEQAALRCVVSSSVEYLGRNYRLVSIREGAAKNRMRTWNGKEVKAWTLEVAESAGTNEKPFYPFFEPSDKNKKALRYMDSSGNPVPDNQYQNYLKDLMKNKQSLPPDPRYIPTNAGWDVKSGQAMEKTYSIVTYMSPTKFQSLSISATRMQTIAMKSVPLDPK